ncbi:hypothetical protein [Streptomyces sp. NBC_00029]|uniref:hypothetical protein n=1 Tax=Streptomyces sp. NBC_00029 TaxID=2903613 RepID=UPI003864FE89
MTTTQGSPGGRGERGDPRQESGVHLPAHTNTGEPEPAPAATLPVVIVGLHGDARSHPARSAHG